MRHGGVTAWVRRRSGRVTRWKDAEAFDELQHIRGELKDAKLVTSNRRTGVPRLNPLLKFEKEARREFCRIWDSLDLDFNCAIDKRPQHPRIS